MADLLMNQQCLKKAFHPRQASPFTFLTKLWSSLIIFTSIMISTLHSFRTCSRLALRTSIGHARLISRKMASAQSKRNQYWLMRGSTGLLSSTWEISSSDVPLLWTLNNNLNLKTRAKPPGSNSLSWSAVSVLILIVESATFHRLQTLDTAYSAILQQKVWIMSP